MGRPGLSNHPKFRRLAYALGSVARARGHLELLWEVAYENGDPRLGDPVSVEAAAQWDGTRGALFEALRDAGGPGRAGFIAERDGVWEVHDLYDHAPDYVRKRAKREAERRTTGRTLDAEVRSLTGHCPPNGGQRPENGTPPAPAPAPAPAKDSPARARVRAEPPQGDQPVRAEPPPPKPAAPQREMLDTPPLLDQLDSLHRTARGRKLEWGPPRHRVAVERALGDLAAEHGDAEVLQRLRNALTYLPGKFPYFAVANDLVQHWGRYADPAPGARVERFSEPAPPRVDRRTLGAVWGPVLERLEAEGKDYTALQLERLRELSSTADSITLEAPDTDAVAWVEHHYGTLLERALAPRKPRLVVAGAGPDPPKDALAEQMQAEDERHATAAEVLRVVRDAVRGS